MKLYSRLPNGVIFLGIQFLISVLYGFLLIYWDRWGIDSIQDELLIFMLPPVFYASYRYNRRIYIPSLIITIGTALWAVANMDLYFWNSFNTIAVVAFSSLFSAEGIYRMHQSRLRIERELYVNQSRLRAVFNDAADAILTKDSDGKIVSANKAFANMVGISVDDLLGKNAFDLFEPAVALNIHQSDRRAFRGEVVRIEESITYNGVERSLLCTKVPLYNDDGEAFEICSIAHDITELKKTQIEREKLIDELQNALKNVRQLNELLPICSSCKKIRDDRGYWKQVDEYIRAHTGAEFTHGLCPDCSKDYFGEFYDEEVKAS